jgi:hypothetical protein
MWEEFIQFDLTNSEVRPLANYIMPLRERLRTDRDNYSKTVKYSICFYKDDVQESLYVRWSKNTTHAGKATTMGIYIIHATMVLLTFGPPHGKALYIQCLIVSRVLIMPRFGQIPRETPCETPCTHVKISHLVASLLTSRQQVVFALLVSSCQQVWNKLSTICNNLVNIIRLVTRLFQQVRYSHDITFKNSLIIHEENTKKNHKRVVSVYVIQIHVDLHKLKLWFSRLRQRLFLKLIRQWTHQMSRFLNNIRVRVVSDIQTLAFGSSFYIRYNTAAHVVNITYCIINLVTFLFIMTVSDLLEQPCNKSDNAIKLVTSG